LAKIDRFLNEVVIKTWLPDEIIFEDIQLEHNNVLTFKTLSELLGICIINAIKNNVQYDVISPSA
jgi:hypothetical protein